MRLNPAPGAVPYLFAVAVTAAAVGGRWLLDPWLGQDLSLITLFPAVAACLWFGGYRPALLSTVLGYVASHALFVAPRGQLGLFATRDVVECVMFLLSSAILIGFGEALRAARRRSDVVLNEAHACSSTSREADRRKDEFLAILAHELRNPLAPLRSALQVMKLAQDDPTTVANSRLMMERQLLLLVRLIDDLMDMSRIRHGKVVLRRERIALSDAVRLAVETSRPEIEARGHQLVVELPSDRIGLDADVNRLAQVFSNLLNNAAKYTEPGGRVTLTVKRHGAEAVVRVRDTGIGIPPEMLPKVFDIFTQVDRTIEAAQGGLGIGLSLVKGLIEMHGGTVEARSEGKGQGSEFVVRLPVRSLDAQKPRSDRGGAAASVPPRRVLIVDDNRDAAISLAAMLNFMGNETKTAHDGYAAIDVAASFRPDLVMLDLGMPRLSGYDTARRIREQPWGRGMVLAALTGWGQEEDRRKSKEAGFDVHLVKPIEPGAMEKLLAMLPRPQQAARASRAAIVNAPRRTRSSRSGRDPAPSAVHRPATSR